MGWWLAVYVIWESNIFHVSLTVVIKLLAYSLGIKIGCLILLRHIIHKVFLVVHTCLNWRDGLIPASDFHFALISIRHSASWMDVVTDRVAVVCC